MLSPTRQEFRTASDCCLLRERVAQHKAHQHQQHKSLKSLCRPRKIIHQLHKTGWLWIKPAPAIQFMIQVQMVLPNETCQRGEQRPQCEACKRYPKFQKMSRKSMRKSAERGDQALLLHCSLAKTDNQTQVTRVLTMW